MKTSKTMNTESFRCLDNIPNLILLDWPRQQPRELGVRYLLHRISQDQSAGIFVGHEKFYWCFKVTPPPPEKSRAASALSSIGAFIDFDLLKYPRLLYSAFLTVARKRDTVELELAVFVLLKALKHSDLILKQLLHRNDSKLWKVMANAVLSFNVLGLYEKNKSLDDIHSVIPLFLLSMMPHWRPEQWKYVLDIGLASFILKVDVVGLINDREGYEVFIQSLLYWKTISCLHRVDRRNATNLSLQFKTRMNRACGRNLMQFILDDSVARVRSSTFVTKSCTAWKCSRRGRYICKGCKLMRYCCRRHQKAHWKRIHSQQCYKNAY